MQKGMRKMEKAILGKGCEHCKRNPSATKPFIEMRRLYIDGELVDKAVESAKKLKLPHSDCVFCRIAHRLASETKKLDRKFSVSAIRKM
jgi:hypothetical protein